MDNRPATASRTLSIPGWIATGNVLEKCFFPQFFFLNITFYVNPGCSSAAGGDLAGIPATTLTPQPAAPAAATEPQSNVDLLADLAMPSLQPVSPQQLLFSQHDMAMVPPQQAMMMSSGTPMMMSSGTPVMMSSGTPVMMMSQQQAMASMQGQGAMGMMNMQQAAGQMPMMGMSPMGIPVSSIIERKRESLYLDLYMTKYYY